MIAAVLCAGLAVSQGVPPTPQEDTVSVAADSAKADSVRAPDANAAQVGAPGASLIQGKDSTAAAAPKAPAFRSAWKADTTGICREPLETALECWRDDPRWANMEIGFPGARSGMLSLRTLESVTPRPFFSASGESPYGLGGQLPFHRAARGDAPAEIWSPVLPLDTPITALHWTRGALGMNQVTLGMRRMAGDRAYFGLEYHSDLSESRFYDYAFNVHQPYLAGWGLAGVVPGMDRDSASLVITDTSHDISATHFRGRLGYWLGPRLALEGFADWHRNGSSLVRPTSPLDRDSSQSLFPASFSGLTLGATAAHQGEEVGLSASFRHASWDRELEPGRIGAPDESAEGMRDRLDLEGFWEGPGRPRLRLGWENNLHRGLFRLRGAEAAPEAEAWSDAEEAALDLSQSLGPLAWMGRGSGQRRSRPDGVVEWLGGGETSLRTDLPFGFGAEGGAGLHREGAPEDLLFRLQPALGLFPNPALEPRSHARWHAGADFRSRFFSAGAAYEQNRFADNWLPRLLPQGDFCRDARARFPGEPGPLCDANGRVPDSLALARLAYEEEVRDILRLQLGLFLGRWSLRLQNVYLLRSEVEDARLASTAANRLLPERVFKGQLRWRRRILDGKLGLQTEWNWEWFSTRYAFASDLDGFSRAMKLDEYLVLDFAARMEVKSFLLYFRGMNMNHDRYAPEPGVHPPGVNFRFGVDWLIRN